jgi:hypothetical protein
VLITLASEGYRKIISKYFSQEVRMLVCIYVARNLELELRNLDIDLPLYREKGVLARISD